MGQINKILIEEGIKKFTDVDEFDSSNINGITYDKDETALYIMFKGNSVYKYDNVTCEEFYKLKESESKGKQFRTTVKGKPFVRIM